jgi:hypothetical protein
VFQAPEVPGAQEAQEIVGTAHIIGSGGIYSTAGRGEIEGERRDGMEVDRTDCY